METNKISIAIDGPAAAGKSTVAKIVARELSYIYIDTGAMYRAITFKALEQAIPLNNEAEILNILKHTEINLSQGTEGQRVVIDGIDRTDEIRSQEVTNNVSTVAGYRLIREELVKRQQAFGKERGVVMDGRDIGTHVIPDAEVKIFLIASVTERAERRFKENKEKGFRVELEQLKQEIEARDEQDRQREFSPLIKAEDAIEIDTTSLSIQQVAEEILHIAKQRLGKNE